MSNWAEDQAAFMRACGQSVGKPSYEQSMLYTDLVSEEARETYDAALMVEGSFFPDCPDWDELPDEEKARAVNFAAELADGAIDTICVCLGLLHSMGVDPQRAWDEVHRVGNMSKIDPATGTVLKREDGKVQKPEGWTPPDMERVVRESWGL